LAEDPNNGFNVVGAGFLWEDETGVPGAELVSHSHLEALFSNVSR
jgi:hypothetical protein